MLGRSGLPGCSELQSGHLSPLYGERLHCTPDLVRLVRKFLQRKAGRGTSD